MRREGREGNQCRCAITPLFFLQRSFKLSLVYYQHLAVCQYRTAQTASFIRAFHEHLTNKPSWG